MSSSEEENEVLDLRKMEDVFACLEVVAMAQSMLSSVDPHTAEELDKVTQALGALSLASDQGDLVQVAGPGGSAQPAMPVTFGERGIDDLVEFISGGKPTAPYVFPADEDDGIYDILTGEKLR